MSDAETPGAHEQEKFDLFTAQALDPGACFLCGVAVDRSTRTEEHVFPEWLLNRHNLWGSQMILLNGTSIPYSQLTVTCCVSCNGTYLSQLEHEVAEAFEDGADAVRALPEERLFLWLAKFYYGLVFRELTLANDRRSLGGETIVSQEMLRQYGIHHLLLRRLLGQVEWNEFPGSLFIFDALDGEDQSVCFDYLDVLDGPFVCMRSGATFVVGFLQDFGAVQRLGIENAPQVTAARAVRVHPFQCLELMAFFASVLNLRDRVPKFIIGSRNGHHQVMVLPQGGLSGRSPFGNWDQDLYRRQLLDLFKARLELDFVGGPDHTGPGHTPTTLVSTLGKPIQAPSVEWNPAVWDDPELLAGDDDSGD